MGGFRLCRIFGLEIRIDYSWFVIFFLIFWTLTVGVFPAAAPQLPSGTHVAMGAAGTLLFFASLLGHELSHSVVARRRGIPVESITLFVFGGLARTRMEAETPRDEFAIAAVGPLASVLFGALFLGIAWLGRAVGWSPAVTVVASYVGLINLVLAVFNLLPGFPLDGGRVFRAAVWKITGDLTRATRWAATGGRWLGYMLMAFGFFEAVFTPGVIGGLWLVFIGWFIRSAADASLAQHLLRQTLRGIAVRDVMTADPVTVPPHLPIDRLVEEYFIRGRHRVYPVVEGERLLGTVALDRVRTIPRADWPQQTVADALTPLADTPTAEPRESVTDVFSRIARESDARVLVTRNGHVEGILTRADLAHWVERAQLMNEPPALKRPQM